MDRRRPSGLLRREQSFRRLFLATLGSGIGTWLALVALELDIFERTHSSGWIAALLIADLLPTFAIGILAGPLIDRFPRRTLMIGADVVRFAAFVALAFSTSAIQIVALAAVVGVATGVFRPSVYAGIPNLVDDADLSAANSLLQVADNATRVVGFVAGGALAAAAGVRPSYWINAATFLVSAVLLAGIGADRLQAGAAVSRGHWQDLKDGFVQVVRSRAMLTVFVAWNIAMLATAAVNVAEPRLALRTFSAGRFGLGLLMGCSGLGLALGAYLASASIARRGLSNVYGASLGLLAFGIGAAACAPNVWVAAACVVVSGGGNGAAVVCNALFVQRGVPDSMRGRAFASLMSSNIAVLMAGMLAAGRLTDSIGARWVWGGAAVLVAGAAVAGFALARKGARGGEPSPEEAELLPVVASAPGPVQQ